MKQELCCSVRVHNEVHPPKANIYCQPGKAEFGLVAFGQKCMSARERRTLENDYEETKCDLEATGKLNAACTGVVDGSNVDKRRRCYRCVTTGDCCKLHPWCATTIHYLVSLSRVVLGPGFVTLSSQPKENLFRLWFVLVPT